MHGMGDLWRNIHRQRLLFFQQGLELFFRHRW